MSLPTLGRLLLANTMIENYVTYLKFLDEKFNRFFKKQTPFICCKKGCGRCCKNAQFPYTQIEVVHLLSGAQKLNDETIEQIMDNIAKIKLKKENYKGDKFLYDCPFLINNSCSVYEYRGIICRSFGLMTVGKTGNIQVPFCCFQGLNYANVMEDDGKNISVEKYQKLNVKEEPTAFNVSYEFLTDPDFARGFNFKFGDRKPLIDWLINKKDKNDE